MLMSFIFLYNMTQCEFIEKIKKIHGDKYDYSLTYIGNKENNYTRISKHLQKVSIVEDM